MFLTFKEVKDSSIANVTAANPDDPQFAIYIIEAVRRLQMRGDWAGTVVPIHTCISRGCVVSPRIVDKVRKIADCRGTIPQHGMFYDFLDWRQHHWHSDDYWVGLGWRQGRRNIVQKGWSPVFQDIMGPGRYLRLYNDVAEDVGKNLTVFGIDNNGQPLRTRNTDGQTWSDGMTLTAGLPYAQSNVMPLRIDRIIKDLTQGALRLFAFNTAADVLEPVAEYEPSDTNPKFLKQEFHDLCQHGGTRGVVALVKLKQLPLISDNDVVIIPSIPGLKLMVQAIVAGEANERAQEGELTLASVETMNRELEDWLPVSEIPVDLGELGHADCIGQQRMR
jgi:hypothetical protein